MTSRSIAASSPAIRPEEELLHAVAREVPGFGGYFLEPNGVLVVYVTDLADDNPVRARIEGIRGRLAGQVRTITVRQGRFDFPSLARWRDAVSNELLGVVPGVVMSDADEAANRVTIGIDETNHPLARETVLRSLERLGIPIQAVRFLKTAAPTPNVNENLDAVPSPVVAGYWIDAGQPGCTLGAVVLHNGNPAAITASHCTANTYSYDGSPLKTSDGAIIGYEVVDPGSNCWPGNCRRADAALIYLSAGVSYDYGRIARTVNTATGWGVYGSLDVDQANPTRTVTGVVQSSEVVSGMYLAKTGQTTGSTSGNVSNTCIDILASDNFRRNCSIAATYYAYYGDSGSPVYTGDGAGSEKLVAIHWGANSATHTTFSSYYVTAMAEIGGSFVSTHPYVPPPNFSLTYSPNGPTACSAFSPCAMVSWPPQPGALYYHVHYYIITWPRDEFGTPTYTQQDQDLGTTSDTSFTVPAPDTGDNQCGDGVWVGAYYPNGTSNSGWVNTATCGGWSYPGGGE